MSTPHPLDPLFAIWSTITEGQRQAIARDFRSRTGGLLASMAFPIPEVLVLVPVVSGSAPGSDVLLRRSSLDVSLPSQTLVIDQGFDQAASRLLEVFPGFVPQFEFLGHPLVSRDRLAVVVSCQPPYVWEGTPLPEGWEVGSSLSPSAPAHHHAAFATWKQISPLRLF